MAYPFRFPVRDTRAMGMSRLELLVLITVAVILIGVAIGPIYDYLTNGKVTRAVQNAHTLDTLLSQYATDNNGVYPVGEGTSDVGTSRGIARNLLENNFTPDASIFAAGSTIKFKATGEDFSKIGVDNISWDFTGGATASTGITSAAPDLLPTLYSTAEKVAYTTGASVTLSGNGPFGKEGMVVAYKNNTAKFILGIGTGSTVECPGFISAEFKDAGPYTQIKP